MNINSAYRSAEIDICRHLCPEGGTGDLYSVKYSYLFNKESRRLNRLLGVSNLNYFGNTNGKK